MTEPGLLVLGLRLVVVVAILSELVPRTVTLWRLRSYDDGLGVTRLRTWIKSTGIALVAGWESLIWFDINFLAQQWLGPFAERWMLDATVWSVLAVGAVGVAFLYWSVEKRQDRQDLEDARLGGKLEADPS